MYGNSSNKTVDLSPNHQSRDSNPTISNVQANSRLGHEDQTFVGSLDLMDGSKDDLEESFEPQCFDVATPNATFINSPDTPQFSEFSNDNTQEDTQNSCDFDLNPQTPASLSQHLDKNHQNQDANQSSDGQCNEAGATSKRSASQILALLGQSRGKFKPPMKEYVALGSKQGSRIGILATKCDDDGDRRTKELKQDGNAQFKLSSKQMPNLLPTVNEVTQSNANFEFNQENGDDDLTSSNSLGKTSGSSLSIHQRKCSTRVPVTHEQSKESGHADGQKIQQVAASSIDLNNQRLCTEVRSGVRTGRGGSHSGMSTVGHICRSICPTK